FRSIPATALFPLFLLLFGPGDPTNTALATWVCALYLSLHVSKALRSTSEAALLTAKSLKKDNWSVFFHVRLKEGLPMIFLGLRTAVSLTVVVVIVAEMFVGTSRGLGKVLIDSAYTYEIPKLYAGILLVGIIGYLLNYLVIFLERRIVHWHAK
ncbi:ABC transporter permease subunit, partial [Candidatus Micrarchaeota archaeon]|nr:ABC transporter permease subunit [Candidatus Micrarchaeota archaeon]